MIDIIFQAVKSFLNTDGRGNFSPTDFNLFLNNSIQEIYNSYINEINQQVNRENRGLINGGLENVADRIREKLLHYLKSATITATEGVYTMPTDYRFSDTITTSTGAILEPCKNREEFQVLTSTVSNVEFPNYLKLGNTIITNPTALGDLNFFYLRKPLFAKWTYVIIQGVEIFNPSATDFQDCDIHPADENELIIRVCQKFGVNLKEQDITAYFQMKEQEREQKQNAS
jgi:hypothetical protein